MAEIITDLGSLDKRSAISFSTVVTLVELQTVHSRLQNGVINQGQINLSRPTSSATTILAVPTRHKLFAMEPAPAVNWANAMAPNSQVWTATSQLGDLHGWLV